MCPREGKVMKLIRARVFLAAMVVGLGHVSVSYAQPQDRQQDSRTPDFKVEIWGDAASDFVGRVDSYVELRTQLEKGLPQLVIDSQQADIRRAERALARSIRRARANAQYGAIFTPAITAAFKSALAQVVDGPTWEAIMDDNPGSFSVRINGTYPDEKPLSTVPANVLAALPQLPKFVEYRFLGRHLVLYDSKARVILDQIRYAIPLKVDTPAAK